MPIVAEKYQFVIGVDTHAASHSFAVIAPVRFPRKSRHPLFASALGARWKDVEHVKSKEVHDRVQG